RGHESPSGRLPDGALQVLWLVDLCHWPFGPGLRPFHETGFNQERSVLLRNDGSHHGGPRHLAASVYSNDSLSVDDLRPWNPPWRKPARMGSPRKTGGRTKMNTTLKKEFQKEMTQGHAHYAAGDLGASFRSYERAHILGQRYVWTHTVSHWWMLRVAWRRKDVREMVGQVTRIIASLIFSRIWVPVGNTGGANVSPLRPMPAPGGWSARVGMVMFARACARVVLLCALGLLARNPNLRAGIERG